MSELSGTPTLARLRPEWTAELEGYPVRVAWAPDGAHLAVALAEGPVVLFDAEGARRATLPGHDVGTQDVAWSPDGARLASGGQDGQLRLWSPGGEALASAPAGGHWVERVAFSPHSGTLATAAGGQLRFWSGAGEPLTAGRAESYTITDLQWLADREQLATSTYGAARLWSPEQAEPLASYPWKGALLAIAVSPDGCRMAAGMQEANIHFWDLARGGDLYMSGYATKVRELSWSADSRILATGGGASAVLWDCAGEGPAGTEPVVLDLHTRPIRALRFDHGGRGLASGARDGSAVVLAPLDDAPARALVRDADVSDLAWCPDDGAVAFAFGDGHLAVCPGPGGP